MTETERLRSLLEGRGIEWWNDCELGPDHTEWMTGSASFTSFAIDDDTLAVMVVAKAVTPEKAIEATAFFGDGSMADV